MSTTEYYKSAVAIGDLKNAALYFEHLVPVYAVLEFAMSVSKQKSGRSEWDTFREKVLPDLIPHSLLTKPDFVDALKEVNQQTFYMFSKAAIKQFSFAPQIKGLTQEEYDKVEVNGALAYFAFIERYGLQNWPLAAEGEPTTAWMPDTEVEPLQPLLTLSHLNLVDASELPWEHVHELRKDQVAQDKLRRLRLFAFQNYSGKSRGFIEDDLLSRISDYEASAKKWGLETTQGTLSVALNSRLAAGALAGSFASAIFGQPLAALVAGSAGVLLELSNIALEVQKRRLAFDSLSRENPVSFISYARKRIEERDAC